MICTAPAVFFNAEKIPYSSEYGKQDFLYKYVFTVAEVIAADVRHLSFTVVTYAVFVFVGVDFSVAVTCKNNFTVVAVFTYTETCAFKGSFHIGKCNQIIMLTLKTVFYCRSEG